MNELYVAEHLRPEARDSELPLHPSSPLVPLCKRLSAKHPLLPCNAVKRFKEEFAAIEQQFHLTKITDKGPELNMDGSRPPTQCGC